MFLNKFREKIYVNRHIKIKLEILEAELAKIRQHSDLLAICPKPTGYNWMGVNRATNNLFPDSVFEIPQYFSHSVYSKQELVIIAGFISKLKFERIVFSGFVNYFSLIIEELKKYNKDIFIGTIYHGSLSEMSGNSQMKDNFSLIINLIKNKKIDRIGFIKKGLDICINKIYNIQTYPIILAPPDVSGIYPLEYKDSFLHIGVLANNQFRKNLHNQVAAALMINNAIVHVSDKKEFFYLNQDKRIVDHPASMPRNNFLSLLAGMKINLYNTYTETWGQAVIESLALGVPCLTNNSSGILDFDLKLKQYLTVEEHDNPTAIYYKILNTLNIYKEISKMGFEYSGLIRQKSDESLKKFVND